MSEDRRVQAMNQMAIAQGFGQWQPNQYITTGCFQPTSQTFANPYQPSLPINMPKITGKKYIVLSAVHEVPEHDTKAAAVDAAADLVNGKDGPSYAVVYMPVAIIKPERKHTVTDVTIKE